MGKSGQHEVRLVSALPPSCDHEQLLILCPFLSGLDPAVGMWLGPLAWHNCNAALLAALAQPIPPGSTVFAAAFGADPFEPWDDLLAALQARGVAGVANLPSVSFFDGEFAQTLTAMNLGMDRELAFLRRAGARGLRIAGCARELADAHAMLELGAQLVITHAGPPAPKQSRQREDHCKRLTRHLGECSAQVLSLYDLVARSSVLASTTPDQAMPPDRELL